MSYFFFLHIIREFIDVPSKAYTHIKMQKVNEHD